MRGISFTTFHFHRPRSTRRHSKLGSFYGIDNDPGTIKSEKSSTLCILEFGDFVKFYQNFLFTVSSSVFCHIILGFFFFNCMNRWELIGMDNGTCERMSGEQLMDEGTRK